MAVRQLIFVSSSSAVVRQCPWRANDNGWQMMLPAARGRARRRVRNVTAAARAWLLPLLLLLLLFLDVTRSGGGGREDSSSGAEADAGAFLGLTNELASTAAYDDNDGNNNTSDYGPEPSPLNKTAFEALSDPELTAPFHEELSTMWSALQFLCQTFDGRQLDGCNQILALPAPGSAAAANFTAHDEAVNVTTTGGGGGGGNHAGGDSGDGTDEASSGGAVSTTTTSSSSSTLHAATLFRFLRAHPLGFGHMKVTLGAEPREALADAAANGQFLLRQARALAPSLTRSFVHPRTFFRSLDRPRVFGDCRSAVR